MLSTVKPQINTIMKQALDTLNQTADKSAKGLIDAGLNFSTSLIGNLPVAGGIISLVMAFLRGFNDAATASSPGVRFSVGSFITAFNTVLKMIQDLNGASATLTKNASNLVDAINGLKVPSLNVPSLNVPSLNVPALNVPSLKAPALNVPSLNVPSLNVPSLNVPSISQFKQRGEEQAKQLLSSAIKNPLQSVANTSLSDVANKGLESVVKQRGGANVRKKISHITRRLKNTLNRFIRGNSRTRKYRNKR
jgi:hypothetical protein